MEDDWKFQGKKILSVSNCTSVRLMGGGLASVRGLEEVELTQVRRIVLESGAFSGGQLKHVSGEILQDFLTTLISILNLETVSSSAITSFTRGTFKDLDLEKMHLVGNTLMGGISSNAFTEMRVKNLR